MQLAAAHTRGARTHGILRSAWFALLLLVPLSVVGAAEWLHQRAARAGVSNGVSTGSTAVIVLGYPARADGRPHPIQRWRVRLGIRTMRASEAELLVFTGGAAANDHIEAETMARLALQSGVRPEAIVVEPAASSTWQNVAYTAPLVKGFERVIIASDPMHAKRARNYWIEQYPDDAGRVFVTDARRPFESSWSTIPTAVVEIARSARHRVMRVGDGPTEVG